MNPHDRRYGGKESHPIPVWNGIFDHFRKIGPALWVFLWCIDRVTDESDPSGVGLVLGGMPVKIERILADIPGATDRSVRRHLKRLVTHGFLRHKRTPYGAVLSVLNSRKFGIWRSTLTGQNGSSIAKRLAESGQRDRTILPERLPQTGRNKEDKTEDIALDAAVSAALAMDDLAPWKALGSQLPMGVPRFQIIFEHYFSTRNGSPLSEAMERTIQRANKEAVKVPKPFYEAKRVVERREAEVLASYSEQSEGLIELEELPWQKS